MTTTFCKILEMKLKLDTGLSFFNSFFGRDVFIRLRTESYYRQSAERSFSGFLKELAQAKIIKKSVILFWLFNMTI